MVRAERYFEQHGAWTIVVARFIPIVRTFANPMAGVGRMPTATFTRYNVLGGFLWTFGVTLLGWVLGKTIPSAEDHLLLIEGSIIVASLVPVGIEVVRTRRRRAASL